MADAANDGYFVPEQVWDRPDIACFTAGRPTGSAAPLNWAEGQYLRLAQSIDVGYNVDTPSVVKAKYRGAGPILGAAGKCIDDAGGGVDNGSTIQILTCNGTGAQSWSWNSGDGTLRALDKCMDVTGGATASGTAVQLWECNGTGAQEWRWRQQSRLVNPQSGRCLDVVGAGGERLQISDCDDTARQIWRLPPERLGFVQSRQARCHSCSPGRPSSRRRPPRLWRKPHSLLGRNRGQGLCRRLRLARANWRIISARQANARERKTYYARVKR